MKHLNIPKFTNIEIRYMCLVGHIYDLTIHSGSITVKLDSKLKIPIKIEQKKKVFVLFMFNLIGYESKTANISLMLRSKYIFV